MWVHEEIGIYSTSSVEVMSIWEGLSLCGDLGYKKIRVFFDSMEALSNTLKVHSRNHLAFSIAKDIRRLLMWIRVLLMNI